MEAYQLNQKVLYTEADYPGFISEVCGGVLTGMYNVRLRSGVTCVSGSNLRPVDRTIESNAVVSEYSLKAPNGKHVRFATRVKFPNGRQIEFMEPMSRKEAIKQAQEVAYREYKKNFFESNPDQVLMRYDHFFASLERGV